MKIIEKKFFTKTRDYSINLYCIGDVHIGALNCAEDKLKSLVKRIASEPNSYWIAGGDMCDAVILQDSKRFDPSQLPDWMLTGGANNVRKNISDILSAQQKRLFDITNPIKDKCIGVIEGNHEYSIMKYHNRDFYGDMCKHYNAPALTDCAFIRLKFVRVSGNTSYRVSTVRVFVCHGNGGGRSSGAEPNALYKLAADKECDILFKGHSHTYCIHPPIPMLSIPSGGELPEDPDVYDKHAANWGAFMYTYKSGPSTYASRANYPVRPMWTAAATIHPFAHGKNGRDQIRIEMNGIRL